MSRKLTFVCTGVRRDSEGRFILQPTELLEAAGFSLTPDSIAWAEKLLTEEVAKSGYVVQALPIEALADAKEVAHV